MSAALALPTELQLLTNTLFFRALASEGFQDLVRNRRTRQHYGADLNPLQTIQLSFTEFVATRYNEWIQAQPETKKSNLLTLRALEVERLIVPDLSTEGSVLCAHAKAACDHFRLACQSACDRDGVAKTEQEVKEMACRVIGRQVLHLEVPSPATVQTQNAQAWRLAREHSQRVTCASIGRDRTL